MHMRDFKRLYVILSAVGTSLASASTIPAQNPPAKTPATRKVQDQRYRYRLLGVYDEMTGDPVEGVQVQDILTGTSAQTTTTGTVSLFFLPDGGSMVRLRKVGYELQTFAVAISPVDTAPITVVLKRVVALPTVMVKDSASSYVSGMLQGAEARMKSHSGGYFMDETELRKWDHATLREAVVSHMPGLTTVSDRYGHVYLGSTRTACVRALSCRQTNCYVTVYQDGVKIYDPRTSDATQRPDVSRMTTTDYAIVEFYPSTTTAPPEYSGACGVLLLWTRER